LNETLRDLEFPGQVSVFGLPCRDDYAADFFDGESDFPVLVGDAFFNLLLVILMNLNEYILNSLALLSINSFNS